jgi:DNA-binding MarR family transcriptional regulator
MTLPQLRLDHQLCFLFHRVGRELNAAYRPLLHDLGLTYPQYLVMLVLWEEDGIGVGAIGDRLALDSATLSPLLQRLEKAGLVSRVRDGADERRVTIHLTEAGLALEQQAAGVPEAVAAHLVEGREDYTALHSTLTSLLARVVRANDAG